MERSYRSSNALFAYAFLLAFTGLLLGAEAVQRLRGGATGFGVFLALLALTWVACAAALALRWGRLRISLRSDALSVSGDGPERRLPWSEVVAVREYRGPAYALSVRDLLPGPYLPHGLLRGETVLEIEARPAMLLHFRQALVDSYGAFRQDVLRSIPRDVPVDLHARWWRMEGPSVAGAPDALDTLEPGEEDGDAGGVRSGRGGYAGYPDSDDDRSGRRSRGDRDGRASPDSRGGHDGRGVRGAQGYRPAPPARIDRTDRGTVDRLSPPSDRMSRPLRTDKGDAGGDGTRRSRDRRS
jgi:hypothetical protein